MSAALLAVPVAAPLLAGGLLIAVPRRHLLRRVSAAVVSAGVLLIGGALLAITRSGAVPSQNVGDWPPGVAIVLVADTFSALMVTVSALLVLLSLAFAAATGDDTNPAFIPLVLICSAGVYGAFLTADLFNLFVFIEVMLVPSYALLTVTGDRKRVAAGRVYLTVNLLASTIFLAGVALLYGLTGTVNLGELAAVSGHGGMTALAAGVVLLALASKAAVVPLHGWLPRAYPAAPAAVTVFFSGLLTKVGVYGIIRIYAVVFDGAPRFRLVIMALALLTMVIGVLGAIGDRTMRGILSFHMVSQIGYLLVGLALFTSVGLAATIFFLVQYVLVKAALLVCAGAVETTFGSGRLDQVGGLARREPALSAAFGVAALSLAGLPPLSGFVAKLSLIRAASIEDNHVAVAIAVGVSFLTLMSMIKIWSEAFWGRQDEPALSLHARAKVRPRLVAPALVLAVPSVLLGILAEPLLALSSTAAAGLVDTAAYVQAVIR